MNEKQRAIAVNNGSQVNDNHHENQELDPQYYDEISLELQDFLFRQLRRKQKVVRLYRCLGCNGNFAIKKFSSIPVICRKCNVALQEKGDIAKRNFVDRTVNKVHKILGGRV